MNHPIVTVPDPRIGSIVARHGGMELVGFGSSWSEGLAASVVITFGRCPKRVGWVLLAGEEGDPYRCRAGVAA